MEMTALAIFLTLAMCFFWWRARVWKRRYNAALHPPVAIVVGEWAKLWAEGFRDAQRTNEWPEEIESRYDN